MSPKPQKPRILLVIPDLVVRKRIASSLAHESVYEIIESEDPEQGLGLVRSTHPEVIISDYRPPHPEGQRLYRAVKETDEGRPPVCILLTENGEADRASLDPDHQYVDEYVEKGTAPSTLLCRIQSLLRIRDLQHKLVEERDKLARANRVLEKNFKEVIEILLRVMETTIPGADNRANMARAAAHFIANRMKLDGETKKSILLAATLHEIGKIGLPERVKTVEYGSLDAAEQQLFHQHPMIGSMIISSISGFKEAAHDVYHQLEHYDGSGTPAGLRGEEIPVGARILRALVFGEELMRAGMTTEAIVPHVQQAMNRILDPVVATEFETFLIQNDRFFSKGKVKLTIDGLREGMVLAEDIYSLGGVKLLPRGVRLKERMLTLIQERSATDPVLGGVYVYK